MGLDYFDNLATDFPLSKGNGAEEHVDSCRDLGCYGCDPILDEFISPQPEEPPSE